MRRPDPRRQSVGWLTLTVACVLACVACGEDDPEPIDAAASDARPVDSARGDASATDGGTLDAGSTLDGAPADMGGANDGAPSDAGETDASALDAAGDASPPFDGGAPDLDLGLEAGPIDTGPIDAGPADSGPPDAGPPDAGPTTGACISGATGTHVVRFRWRGSGAGSTAYVDYEVNDLPDTSRWHVSANDMSFTYRPVFDDIFLGEGGLDLEGSAFIDIELSTAGLSSVRAVTIAIYGRSFNTTASGSFSWQTFDGIGATETNSVSNVAPYSWYGGDATTELPPGDDGVLLRLRAGPSSDALIVNRVEICFDAS